MQIKTTERCHFSPTGRAVINRQRQVLARRGRNKSPFALLAGKLNNAATVKTVWQILKKLNTELPMPQQFHF
jgi:hypothetical protein